MKTKIKQQQKRSLISHGIRSSTLLILALICVIIAGCTPMVPPTNSPLQVQECVLDAGTCQLNITPISSSDAIICRHVGLSNETVTVVHISNNSHINISSSDMNDTSSVKCVII